MTVTIKSHKNRFYYIHMVIENNLYIVQVYPINGNGECCYPIKRMTYAITEEEKKNALATFRRYVKRYSE